MRTRLLGGVAALIVAIIGTVLLFTYVNGADARAYAGTETRDVYVVQKAIAAGTPVGSISGSVAKRPVPQAVLPEGAVADLGDIQGKVTSVALEPGETVLAARFVDPKALAGPSRSTVPAGMQEITIKLPIERVVGGVIQAGDTVGVALSFPKEDNTPAQTQLSFHKVLVTGVQFSNGTAAQSQSNSQQNQQGGSLGSSQNSTSNGEYLVTLARTAADTEKIVFASEFGKIYLTKEPADAAENSGAPIDRTKVLR